MGSTAINNARVDQLDATAVPLNVTPQGPGYNAPYGSIVQTAVALMPSPRKARGTTRRMRRAMCREASWR
jgi:hypothetical protein